MRCLPYTLVLLAAVGCHNHGTSVSNPFLAPDRVPPPSTRTLLPGTAQPYYPGDPVPGAPSPGVVAPGVVAPGVVAPTPAPVVQPGATYPPTAPVTPPGGWSQPTPSPSPYNVQPTSAISPGNQITTDGQIMSDGGLVSIAPDSESLRFTPHPAPEQANIVQVAAQQTAVENAYVYSPPVVPNAAPIEPQPQQMRLASLPSGSARDGFRPQGSTRRTDDLQVDRPDEQSFRGAPTQSDDSYGNDATYSWLRGQLQYFPETGVWGIRYLAPQMATDALGGVAVVANPQLLGGLQPGDFLLVQGVMDTAPNGDGTFTPLFSITGIQRQR